MKRPDLIVLVDATAACTACVSEAYGKEQAESIFAALAHATLETAVSNWPGDVYLCPASDASHERCLRWSREFHVHLAALSADEYALRVRAEFLSGMERRGASALLSCEVPHCRPEAIEQAYECLAKGGNVLGPTEDDACYLVGLQRPYAQAFDADAWRHAGGRRVTLDWAAREGLEFDLLPRLRRVEAVADLWLIGQKVPALRRLI